MSARISGVKNFESKAVSLLRGLPLSQVQSQSEKGAICSFFAGAPVAGPLAAEATERAGLALKTDGVAGVADAVAVADAVDVGCGTAVARLLSSNSNCSMRNFIASNSFAMSSERFGSGVAVGGTVAVTPFVALGPGPFAASCRAATLVGASASVAVCAYPRGVRTMARLKTSSGM